MRRTLVAAVVAASLLAGPSSRSGLFDPLWSFLASLWGDSTTKEGCGMDPNGRCTPAPQPQTKEGCGMDPWGRCTAAPQQSLDAGCGMDPWGCPSGGS